jgi:hypothetical protein
MVEKIIILLIFVGLFGCTEKECSWPPQDIEIPLRDSNINWLKGLPIDTTLTASSNKGRNLSYRLVPRFGFVGFGSGNCKVYKGQEYFVSYTSSIYNYNFNILIYRHWDEDKFVLGDAYFNSYFSNYYDCKSEIFLTNNENNINFSTEKSNREVFNLDTVFSKIDTLVIGNKTYYDVYKIDFFEKKYSLDDKVKVFYIDRKKGVVRFDTFDGEIWTLNFK